jgi:predicted Zn-dependent protease
MRKIAIALALLLPMAACADLSPTQQRAMTGTAIGAAGGAAIGAMAGNAGMGALAGAGAGLVGGLVVDQVRRNEANAYRQGYNSGRQSN